MTAIGWTLCGAIGVGVVLALVEVGLLLSQTHADTAVRNPLTDEENEKLTQEFSDAFRNHD